MDEKKGMFIIRTKDLIIAVLVVVFVFLVVFEFFKINHKMNFAGIVNQVNSNTAWITNVNRASQQAQQQRATQQKPPQPPKENPEKN